MHLASVAPRAVFDAGSAQSERILVSGFGPTVPVVPAWERAWQTPHLDTNSCFPVTTLVTGCLIPHPPSTSSTSAHGSSAASVRGLRPRALTIVWARTLSQPEESSRHRSRYDRRVRTRQKYRMRAPSTGREIIIEAEPDEI